LDANRWARDGVLAAGWYASGDWQWTYPSGGRFVIHYDADTREPDAARVRLSYAWVWTATGQQESAAYTVSLTTTRPHFGGLRWWFLCPLSVEGRPCGRRVAKLYLPPAGRHFGCRHCYRLTYTSCQESHQFDGLYRRMALELGVDFAEARRALRRLGKGP
jgi:hypothetical protein